ncbi:MAG TPA: dienelactone hydrolase family protein [Pseudomonadales bacterium]
MASIFFADEPVTLDNGLRGVPWQVETANPASFFELLSGSGPSPTTQIYAQTFLPSAVRNPPAVIVVPGSLGVAPSHLYKAELLTAAGFAACVLDPFGKRGVTSTVANQAQYSFAASAWDVIAALVQLAARGEVDGNRIGAQGHSRGGSAVLSAACLIQRMGLTPSLAGVYAAYPWCGQQFLNPRLGRTRVRSVVGDRDEWCLAQQVQGYMQAMRLAGGDATWRIFAGAHHSFDRDTPVELIADASVAPGAPTLYIDDDGAMIHPASGQPDPAASERDLMLYGIKAGYGVRGAHIGSSGDLAQAFHDDMMSFWRDCLGG